MFICDRMGVAASPPEPDSKLGIAVGVLENEQPLNGLRHPPTETTSGWYLWSGTSFSDAEDFFQPMHIEHLAALRPDLMPYLDLPPGWRFLLAPGHEDVWFDESLLHVDD
jgi:hypothetical protein